MTLPVNTEPWWDWVCGEYLRRGDDRDRAGEYAQAARLVESPVVEIGPGLGAFARYLLHADNYVGVDCSGAMVAEARRRVPDRVFVQGNLFAVADAWAGAFNTVCAFQVLEHMVNPDVGMAAFRSLARHRLVLTVPAGMPSADQTAGDGHVHGWTDQEAFERYLERWGTVVPVASDDNHLGAMVQWA